MNTKYLEAINTVLDSEAPPSREKLMSLMDDTMEFFQDITSKMGSQDPKARQEAVRETMAIKEILESKMEKLCEKTGLNLAQISTFVENPFNITPEEQERLETATAEIKKMQNGNLREKKLISNKLIG